MLSDFDHISVPMIREAVMGCEDIDLEQKVAILTALDIEVQTERSFRVTIDITCSAYDTDGNPIEEDAIHSAIGHEVDRVTAGDIDAEEFSIEDITTEEVDR